MHQNGVDPVSPITGNDTVLNVSLKRKILSAETEKTREMASVLKSALQVIKERGLLGFGRMLKEEGYL